MQIIYANMDRHVLLENQATRVTVPKDLWENIVKKRIFVPVVHVTTLENVQTMRLIFHAVASIIIWDQHAKFTIIVLENRAKDMEYVF